MVNNSPFNGDCIGIVLIPFESNLHDVLINAYYFVLMGTDCGTGLFGEPATLQLVWIINSFISKPFQPAMKPSMHVFRGKLIK